MRPIDSRNVTFVTVDQGEINITLVDDFIDTALRAADALRARFFILPWKQALGTDDMGWGVIDTENKNPPEGIFPRALSGARFDRKAEVCAPLRVFPPDQFDAAIMFAVLKGAK